MTAIAYDLPILNLIAGLDATEHVTHTRHRKTKVTLHHNGGRLSHQGVLDVWKVRPASAHFNCDAPGTVAQYVRVAEYAWATGSTIGNSDSISIEMCNATLAPDWVVGEATWRSAARLAGWLFARVIGERPTRANLVLHSYWSATDCAGPYIRRIYDQVLVAAQQSYDRIIHGIPEDDMATGADVWNETLINPKDKNPGQAKIWLMDTNAHAFNSLAEIRAMRAEMRAGFANLSDDETKILTALASLPVGGEVGPEDVEQLATSLRDTLGAAVAGALAERLADS